MDKYKITKPGGFCTTDTTVIKSIEEATEKLNPTFAKNDLHLAQVFKKAGYSTYAVGKLEWGFIATRKQMKDRGWDEYYGYLDHQKCHGFYPSFLFESGKIDIIEGNTHPDAAKHPEGDGVEERKIRWNMEGKKQFAEDIFINKIVSYIERKHEDPFFLYFPTLLPHGPTSIPTIHPEIAENDNLNIFEKEYASMVKMLDTNVGIIINTLKEQGLYDNTIIIFMADNL